MIEKGISMQLLGEIRLFPYEDIPAGWMPCRGQALHIHEYPKLYMLLGDKFGKDGDHRFLLPEMTGAVQEGFTYCIATEGDIPKFISFHE